MIKILVVAGALLCSVSHAKWLMADPANMVVKIQSGIKGMPPRLTGSGSLFRYQNSIYALTSDHILYRTNQNVIHVVWLNKKPVLAELLFSDWGRRFALLKLNGITEETLKHPDIPDWKQLPDPYSRGHTLFGYPAATQNLVRNIAYSGRDSQNYPNLAAQVDTVWETFTHAEFGMSGGAALLDFGHQGYAFFGIISHQVYNTQNPTFITRYGPGQVPEGNSTLIIPLTEIKPVVDDYLRTGSSPLWNFLENSASNGFEVVDTGHLSFYANKLGGAEYAKDVGVRFYPKRTPKTVRYSDKGGWFKKFEEGLRVREGKLGPSSVNMITVIGYRETGRYDRWSGLRIKSLVELVRLFDNPKYEPVVYLSYDNIDTIREKIRDFGRRFGPCTVSSGDANVQELCMRLNWIYNAIDIPAFDIPEPYYKWVIVKPSDLDDLLTNPRYQNAWSQVRHGQHIIRELRDFLKTVTL